MAFISCDIMVMHFNVLSFIAASSQLFIALAACIGPGTAAQHSTARH